MTIATLDDLRKHLQWAIQLEHTTIPPYLCALYSIKPGHNREASEALASVAIEEMLHMTLAANILNAVGGQPSLDQPGFVARYPSYLPHSAERFLVPLARFSPATIETFMQIEKPEKADAPPEEDRFQTIGQFYLAIEEALPALCETLGEEAVFCGDPTRQITPDVLEYRGSGTIIPVYDLVSAVAALDEIEEQGEGLRYDEVWDGDRDMFHPELQEVAHYFRYHELTQGRFYQPGDTPATGPTGTSFDVDWDAVYPMRDNPRTEDYPEGSPIRTRMDAFNLLYSDLLRGLHRALNGEPERMFATVSSMMDLRTIARELMQMPSGDGDTTAGPSFEYVAPVSPESGVTTGFSITVRKDGPYVIEGAVPLARKSIVYSEWGEPLTWRKDAVLQADQTYRLCRCGQSKHKPFCDGTHARAGFEGDETAPTEPSSERREGAQGAQVALTDDPMLCSHAGFCGNRIEKVWQMIERTEDSQVRFQLMQMVERCPSGRLIYELEEGPLEPDLPAGIAVTKDGPYWVTGGIPVTMSDGRKLEIRNRVTLCRCGQSSNKPLCDGTHEAIEFRDG